MKTVYQDQHFDLVVECKKGNQNAFHDLYKLYAKVMYNIALKILSDEPEAADILQESFLYAFTHIGEFKQEVSFGLWIKQIIIHKSIAQLRKRKLNLIPIDEMMENELPENEEYNEQDIIANIKRVKEAILGLPDGCRIVLTLYLLEGYDHEEIAKILNISESTSRSQLTRGKAKLIELLKAQERYG